MEGGTLKNFFRSLLRDLRKNLLPYLVMTGVFGWLSYLGFQAVSAQKAGDRVKAGAPDNCPIKTVTKQTDFASIVRQLELARSHIRLTGNSCAPQVCADWQNKANSCVISLKDSWPFKDVDPASVTITDAFTLGGSDSASSDDSINGHFVLAYTPSQTAQYAERYQATIVYHDLYGWRYQEIELSAP